MKNIRKNNFRQIITRSGTCFLLLLTPYSIFAQEEIVDTIAVNISNSGNNNLTYEMFEFSGYVKDAATQNVLSGVRVAALNNNLYTAMTDENGYFTLKVPSFVKSLYIDAPGYNGIQYAIAGLKGEIEAQLYSVVFNGAYENVTRLSAANSALVDITTSPTIEAEIGSQLGADVHTITRSGTPAIGAAMFIRGLNSLNANAQPLVILDGVMLDLQANRMALHEGFYTNVLSALDPDDVEKVTVLKNATSLYGARGANGVILIDTKRARSMATKIEASVYGSFILKPELPDLLNSDQYRIMASDVYGSFLQQNNMNTSTIKLPWLNDDPNYYYYNMYHNNTDWKKEVYREAAAQNYKVNVQGGDNVAMYNLSLGYMESESVVKENDFSRLNIRFNTDIELLKNLKTQFNISYSNTTRDLRDDGFTTSYSPNVLALIKSPFLSPYAYDANGNLTGRVAAMDWFGCRNPLTIFSMGSGDNKNRHEYTLFNVQLAPRYEFSKNMSFQTSFNYSLSRMNERYYLPETGVPDMYTYRSKTASQFAKQEAIYSDSRLEWKKQLGNHYVGVYGGFRLSYYAYDSNYQLGYNTGNDKIPDISTSLDYREVGGADDKWMNFSYYANADYNYQNKYFVQGTLTAETSSRFGKETDDGLKMGGLCWGIFPSIQAGWLISSESWFRSVSFVDYLKLTAGYDLSGNDDVDYNASRTYFASKRFMNKAIGLQMSNIGNEKLQWETTKRFNIGLETNLFNNRVNLAVDFFKSKTDNLLTLKELPYVAGLKSMWSNEGALENKGYEIRMNVKVLNLKDWKWEVGATAGHYKNKITSLPDNKSYITNIVGASVLTQSGYAAGVFYGYKTLGVFATDEAAAAAGKDGYLKSITQTGAVQYFKAGDMHFADRNDDGIIDEKDMAVIGDPNPDLYGNIHTTLNYKRLTLNVLFNYSLGNDIYNYQRRILESGGEYMNQTTAMLNRWTTEGQITDIPKITYGDPMGNSRFSERWIEDGSYLRLKNISLSYRVPVPVNWSWLQGLTVWGAAENLVTFTKYLGNDPEFSGGNDVLYQGIDFGTTPLSRSFSVGLKINL